MIEINFIAILKIILSFLTLSSIVFYLFSAFSTVHFFRRRLSPKTDFSPPLSLMIPVCGLDAGAWNNWLSFCQQDYPDYEILFGVRDLDDLAIPVLKELVATFPKKVRLYTGLSPLGANHKDSILNHLLAEAKHQYLVFADSDVRVTPDYLQSIIAPLAEPKIGLVTCAFIGRNPQSLGAAIASFGRCFDFIPSALISRLLDGGVKFAVGATLVTRKATLTQAGGLHFNRIGSDYNLGKRMAGTGYRVELSQYILESDTGNESLWDIFKRELRWARTIRFNRGGQYYGIVFCFGTVYSPLLLLVCKFAGWSIVLTLLTWSIRYLQVRVAIVLLDAPQLSRWLWTLPIRDGLSFLIWVGGAFGQKVFWRGRHLQITEDGIIQEWSDH